MLRVSPLLFCCEMGMMYFSKGEAYRNRKGCLTVTHMGRSVRLGKESSEIWERGRFRFCIARRQDEIQAVAYMANVGIAELEMDETESAKYRMLLRCIITIREKGAEIFLSPRERRILRWLRYSGFRIGIAELVALEEKHIQPNRRLLSDKNWRDLAEKIYGAKPLSNNKLERQMEHSKSRNDTVAALMHLVKRKQVRLY